MKELRLKVTRFQDLPCCMKLLHAGGTVVLMRADQIVHEVRPSTTTRAALTCWMHAGTQQHASREAENIMRRSLMGCES